MWTTASTGKGTRSVGDHRQEGVLVEVVGVPALDEVLPLLGRPQLVDDDDIVDPLRVEFRDKGAADEPGAAGDDDHNSDSLIRNPWIPAFAGTHRISSPCGRS